MWVMGNKDSTASRVQLGNWEVESSAVEEAGVNWADIVSGRLPQENILPPRAGDDFPLQGWRLLHSSSPAWASEVLILGAPSELRPGRWVVVQLSHDRSGWQFAAPSSYLPVPVRDVRRQGLRLEWAKDEFFMTGGSEPKITVVLVNESTEQWTPTEEDLAHVQGIVLDQHGNQIGNGWYAHKRAAQLPALRPGQRTVLAAFRNNPELTGLPSGPYTILAFLTALDLRTAAPASLTVRDGEQAGALQ